MSDLFHERVPFSFIDSVFDVMAMAEKHTFQVLTKRPEIARQYLSKRYSVRPLPNVWIGTSIENDRWTCRADELRETPAAVRFISAEPLLGPLPSLNLTGIDWLIVGGESGPKHRPISEEWVRKLRDACIESRTAFFFKQWGGIRPKSGGRLLDGREWSQYPRRMAVAA